MVKTDHKQIQLFLTEFFIWKNTAYFAKQGMRKPVEIRVYFFSLGGGGGYRRLWPLTWKKLSPLRTHLKNMIRILICTGKKDRFVFISQRVRTLSYKWPFTVFIPIYPLTLSTQLTFARKFRTNSVSLWCVFIASAFLLANDEALSMRSGRRVPKGLTWFVLLQTNKIK